VAAVAWRLAVAGAPLCATHYPATGMLLHHLPEYAAADRPGQIRLYGLDRGPGVLTVLAGSPAAQAGLVAGDVLLSVNGTPFPSPARMAAESDSKKWRKQVKASELQLEQALTAGPARLRVLREGREIDATLGSTPACLGRIRLAVSPQMNAFSQGDYVVMTTGMLGYLRSDDELAVVLGHELSHDILGHPAMDTGDKLLASFGVNTATYWKREEAADRLGLRLMHAAGYDLNAAIPFWRRYLTQYDGPQVFRYHPSLGGRERIVREEMAAIARVGAK
jgi:hypothetical protein